MSDYGFSMLYRTHEYLGIILYPVICEQWNVSLSKKRFVRGSVKPDMSSLFVRHPHFWRRSRKFVFKKIEKLCRKTLSTDTKNKKFSENLGIVLHYTADFFTSVHNIVPNRLQEHINYEVILHEAFCHRVTEKTIRRYPAFGKNLLSGEISIKERLTTLHKLRREGPKNTDTDISEILAACLMVTAFIMDEVTSKQNQETNATNTAVETETVCAISV